MNKYRAKALIAYDQPFYSVWMKDEIKYAIKLLIYLKTANNDIMHVEYVDL